MKKNEKGFTLIELLAVIVILAIIALIATPIVIGSINDARKKAAETSTDGIIKSIELGYTQASENPDLPEEITIEFSDNGFTVKNSQDNTDVDSVKSKILINGEKPTDGTITIKNGVTTIEKGLKINGFTCTQKDNKYTCE